MAFIKDLNDAKISKYPRPIKSRRIDKNCPMIKEKFLDQ